MSSGFKGFYAAFCSDRELPISPVCSNNDFIAVFPNINYRCIIGSAGSAARNTINSYWSAFGYEDGGYYNNAYSFSQTGGSGGTTSFNSEISAVGGSGGRNASSGAGGNGAPGGISGSVSVASTYGPDLDDEWAVWHFWLNAYITGGAGSAGYIWLNNFKYK